MTDTHPTVHTCLHELKRGTLPLAQAAPAGPGRPGLVLTQAEGPLTQHLEDLQLVHGQGPSIDAAQHGHTLLVVGVSIPRTSQVQRTAGHAVPPDQMRPGDLILINHDGGWARRSLRRRQPHGPRSPTRQTVEETELGYWRQFPWSVPR